MNIYLITSESYKLLNDEVTKILGSSLNVVKFDLRVDNLKDVINEANYFSLTNEKKYIVVKGSDALFKASKKKDNDNSLEASDDTLLLDKYLDAPNNNSILVFTSMTSPDKRKKIVKKIDSVGKLIIIPTLNKKDFIYKCMNILQEHKYKIDYVTADYICNCSYYNYDILLSELDKIYKLIKPTSLTKEILVDVVAQSLDGNVYGYINALLDQKLDCAFAASKDFTQLKIDPIMVMIMVAKEYQMLLFVKISKNLKELQSHFKKEDWQMQNYLNYAKNYSVEELKKIIIKLGDYDYKIKSGKLDKDFLLDFIAMDICS